MPDPLAANEQLQRFFNDHIFKMELDEYAKEGIDGSKVSYKNNQPTLDMIMAKKPAGAIANFYVVLLLTVCQACCPSLTNK